MCYIWYLQSIAAGQQAKWFQNLEFCPHLMAETLRLNKAKLLFGINGDYKLPGEKLEDHYVI